jgi:hypothetical protein
MQGSGRRIPTSNSPRWDAFATVIPDGKYMLFQRGINEKNKNVDIYWVDARIIEDLKRSQEITE